MKVRKHVQIELCHTEFDDGKRWISVELRRPEMPARTLYQSIAQDRIPLDDLHKAFAVLCSGAEVVVNRLAAAQQQLF